MQCQSARFHVLAAVAAVTAGTFCFAPASHAAITDSDLVLHYTFDGLSSATDPIPDTSGHGNTGSFVDLGNGGGPTTDAIRGSGAYKLSAVQTPSTFTLPSDQFSIAMWVKFPSGPIPNDIQMLATNSAGGFSTNGFRLYLNDYQTQSGRIILETGDGSAGAGMAYNSVYSGNTDGNYHLLVWTMDLTANHAFTWWDNTYLADSGVITDGTGKPDFSLTGPIRFGGTLDNFFAPSAQIDDVRIYHGVLDQDDMAALMTAPTPEPASLSVLGLAAVAGLSSRRRHTA